MKSKIKYSVIFGLCLLNLVAARDGFASVEKDSLRAVIERIIPDAKGKVGVAVMGIEDGDTLSVMGRYHFPMQSVFKFPLTMCVLDLVDSGKLSLEQKIHVRKKDLLEDTWSPLREKYPLGDIDLTIGELLEYSVSQSDNNATDILFRIVGIPKTVQAYLRKIGIKGITISANEAQMHEDWNVQFLSWCEPVMMAELLKVFYERKYLSASSSDFLWKLMTESKNSAQRIRGLLPPKIIVAHKTGTSGHNDEGISAATNDVGIITLPNGKHVAIVVYVSMTRIKLEASEAIIARISKAVYDYFITKQ